jgi:hypothetical protein
MPIPHTSVRCCEYQERACPCLLTLGKERGFSNEEVEKRQRAGTPSVSWVLVVRLRACVRPAKRRCSACRSNGTLALAALAGALCSSPTTKSDAHKSRAVRLCGQCAFFPLRPPSLESQHGGQGRRASKSVERCAADQVAVCGGDALRRRL